MTAAVVLFVALGMFFLGASLGALASLHASHDAAPLRIHCDECGRNLNCSRSLGLHWAAEHMGPPKLRVVRTSDPPEAA